MAVLTGPDSRAASTQIEAVREHADRIEVRLDRFRSGDGRTAAELAAESGFPLIFACRRPADGGAFEGTERRRESMLRSMLERFAGARIDVEAFSKLEERTRDLPDDKRILSFHDFEKTPDNLLSVFESMRSSSRSLLKIVPTAKAARDVLAVRGLLRAARKASRDLIAFSMGEAGIWSRCLAPVWGSWCVYASALAGAESAPGQITAESLRTAYRFHALGPRTRILAPSRASDAVEDDPALFNGIFGRAGIDAVCLPGLPRLDPDDMAALIRGVPLAGVFEARAGRRQGARLWKRDGKRDVVETTLGRLAQRRRSASWLVDITTARIEGLLA